MPVFGPSEHRSPDIPMTIAATRLLLMVCLLIAGVVGWSQAADLRARPGLRVLVFSATAGFRHDSIDAGQHALQSIGDEAGWTTTMTEDAAALVAALPGDTDVVVFLNTTGDILDDDQQRLLRQFVETGGGFVGIHAAADTEHDWPWYRDLVGARFRSHPAVQRAEVQVCDVDHPATRHLGARWVRTDEWYDYDGPPGEHFDVLLRLDESTYRGGTMGTDHPIAWCGQIGMGRSFYSGAGHTRAAFAEPGYRMHLRAAVRWAAGTP